MKNKSIKKNYFYNTANQILRLLAPLITAPYTSRVLGADGIGTYSYANSIASYFTLFATMGITTYGQREISYAQDDIVKRSNVFWETKIFTVINVLLCSLAYGCFLFVSNADIIYFVLYLNILTVAFDISWLYQGMENFGRIVRRNFIFRIINITYIFIFVKNKDDLIMYVAGMSGFVLVSTISLWFDVKKYITKPNWKGLKPFRNVKTIFSLFIPTIAIEIYTVLDKTMIGVFAAGTEENGFYEQAYKLAKIVLTLVTALGTTMVPRIGYLYEKREMEKIKEYIYRSYRFVLFLGIPLCLGLSGVAYNFVPWFYGDGYDKVVDLLMVTSWLILAVGINNVTGVQLLIPTKRQNLFTKTVVIGAIANFLMNLLLIPHLFSVGAAIASVLAETLIAIVQLIFVRKEISIKKVFLSGMNYYISGAVMFAVLLLERNYLSPSIINTLCMVCSGALVYFGVLVLLKDRFLYDNTGIVLKILNNKWRK